MIQHTDQTEQADVIYAGDTDLVPAQPGDGPTVIRMHAADLVPHPNNARRRIARDDAFLRLADSIERRGVIETMIGVRTAGGRVMLLSGHRRRAAIAYLVEEGRLPVDHPHCYPLVRIEDADVDDQMEIIFAGNEHHEPVGPVDEGHFYQSLVDQGWPKVQIAARLGASAPRIDNRIDIVSMCEEIQDMYAAGRLPLMSAGHLVAIENESDRLRLARMLAGRNLALSRIETLARQVAEHGMDALFNEAVPVGRRTATKKAPSRPNPVPAGRRIGLAALQAAVAATCSACDAAPRVRLPEGLDAGDVNAVAESVCNTCSVRDLADACAMCPLVDLLARLGRNGGGR